MAMGASPAVARHRLRRVLRETREECGLTQRQVAKSLEWSMSKVNRIESGEVTISSTDLQALLRLLGLTDQRQVDELLELARTSRRHGWWDDETYREHLTPALVQAIQFEAQATAIRSYQPLVIPGLLQTRAYMETLLAGLGGDHLPQEVLDARFKVRRRWREQFLQRTDRHRFLLVLDESVLLRTVGGPRVMSEQLYDLLDLVASGRVLVRILPLEPTASFAAFGLFTIYDCADQDVALLYRESYEVDEAEFDPQEITRYRRIFERIWRTSLSDESTVHQIEARAATLRANADRSPAPGG